jgi:hypothetical protein
MTTPEKQPRVHSAKYPPVNRTPNRALTTIDMLLAGKDVFLTTDPNEIAMLSQTETLELGEPLAPSTLTGEPGYMYEDDEVKLYLTLPEMYRFLKNNLRPKEYFQLRELFGIFYAIKDRYYDEETGIAFEPRSGPTDHKTFMFQCMNGTLDPEDIDDQVDIWHTAKATDTATAAPLHEFLGMREDEYAQWMKDSSSLYKILFIRMRDYGTE